MYISGMCNIESIATKKFLCSLVSNNKIFAYCVILLDLATYGTLLIELCTYDIISWAKVLYLIVLLVHVLQFLFIFIFIFYALFLTLSLLCYISYFKIVECIGQVMKGNRLGRLLLFGNKHFKSLQIST